MDNVINKENVLEMFSKARELLTKPEIIDDPIIITPISAYKEAKEQVWKDEHYKIVDWELWRLCDIHNFVYMGWVKLLEDKPLK